MNIITFSNSKRDKQIERIGTIKESMGFISGYLQALSDRNIDIDDIEVTHKYINSSNVMSDHSDWIDTDTKE